MGLPVVNIAPKRIRLPDGRILVSTLACKVSVQLAANTVRRCTFVVVDDLSIPFVLGISFLNKTKATINVENKTITIKDDKTNGSIVLNACDKPYTCRLSEMAAEAKTIFSNDKYKNIYTCTAKQAKKYLKRGAMAWTAFARSIDNVDSPILLSQLECELA